MSKREREKRKTPKLFRDSLGKVNQSEEKRGITSEALKITV